MKSWWIKNEAGASTLELREVPVPEPKAGELLVRMRGAALNRGEFMGAIGLHAAGSSEKAAGLEGAGEVIGVGAGVSLKIGARVMGRAQPGFAEYAIFDAREAIPVPERFSWEQAACASVVLLTAYDMLFDNGALQRGEWLLITGASSGVGVASLQTAKLIGAKVIGTSGSADKLARLKELGLDAGVQVRGGGFQKAVMQATAGRGVDLVVNNVGGTVFAECVRSMAYKGRLATVGYVDGSVSAAIDLEALHAKRLHLFGVSNKMRSTEERAATVTGFVRDVLPALADGRISPVIDRVYPFAELPAARAHMQANAHLGKIVVMMP